MAFIVNKPNMRRLKELTGALPLSLEEKEGPVLNRLAATHCVQVQEAFNTEGASTGAVWAPWSAAYAVWRKKQAGGGILSLTHRLFSAVGFPSSDEFVKRFVPPNTYQFGFFDQIGAWHVAGTGTMPPRSMMNKTDSDVEEFLRTFFEFWRARTLAIVRNAAKI